MVWRDNKVKIIVALLSVATLIYFIYLYFNSYGIQRYNRAKAENAIIKAKIKAVDDDIMNIYLAMDSLRNKDSKEYYLMVERVARQKYNMSRPGEIGIKFKEKDK